MPLGMLGKYERLDVLGHGVSGIVYLAKDTLLNKQVALKEVDVQAGDMRRFLEEARVMDRLRHPNIVRVNGVDRIEGKVVIDMEYVRGDNLQNLLRAEGRLPVDRALDIAIQVLDALDYAHRMQTVHRDIKPANILVGRDGAVKLADFGLAEILATNAYAGGAGTYAYMAPEDFAEEERSDNQSDIWAVGVTLYEMLTANRPFQVLRAKDPFAWKRVLETELPTPLSAYLTGAPAALQTILYRALARDKRQRYPTAGAFRDDLIRLRENPALIAIDPDATAVVTQSKDFAPREAESAPRSGNGLHAVLQTETIPRTGPEVVVADARAALPTENAAGAQRAGAIPGEEKAKKPRRMPFARRQEAKLIVEPAAVNFGTVRKGDAKAVRLHARIVGLEGRPEGRILHNPGWLTVHPTAFDRAKQVITLTAHTDRAWQTGHFQETVRIETNAGTAEIPVRLSVLKPRPAFLQVAAWYVPLLLGALLPALSVAFAGSQHVTNQQFATLVPSAAVASGLLSVMLLLVAVAADLGIAERIACGVLALVMSVVLGATAGAVQSGALRGVGMHPVMLTGGIIGAVLLLQLLYLSRWKLWACAILLLGLLIGGTFLRVLIP